MRRIDTIIIHCADTPNGRKHDAADIDKWHRERGFDSCGYHYVIGIDGLSEGGRPLMTVGAHAYGHNGHSVGICLIGRDRFTGEQWETLAHLVQRLMVRFNIPSGGVLGHREVSEKPCPNFDVRAWVDGHMKPVNTHLLDEACWA